MHRSSIPALMLALSSACEDAAEERGLISAQEFVSSPDAPRSRGVERAFLSRDFDGCLRQPPGALP